MTNLTDRIENVAPRRFRQYPAYKASGVEWLDEIPAHWNSAKIVRLSRPGYKTFVDGDWIESPYITSDGIRLIQTGNIGTGEYREKGFRYICEETFANFKCTEVMPGDVLICRLGEPVARACLAPDLGKRMITSVDVCILKNREDAHAKYLVYTMSSQPYLDWVRSRVRGSTRDRISRSMLGSFSLPLSPLNEQRAIAAFLDRETAKIDGLVARKERLIELLQEKRTALITRAVTRGLDPNVPMKDSGVEWLGEIPAHWDVKRTKFAATLRSGHTPSRQNPEYWKDCTIPWFGLADVWQIRDGQVEYVQATAEKISEIGLANSAARLLPKGTVILSRTASVGFSAVLGVDMATTQDFVNWVCGPSLRPEYLLYVFRAMGPEFRRLAMGSTHQTIYMPDVGGFSTPVPPVPEQDEIVAFIRKETAAIDALTVKVRRAIDLLKEFRTTLISAAVTGKIDVREEAA